MLSLFAILQSVILLIVLGSQSPVSSKDAREQFAKESDATRHKALCSSYSDFKPCEVFVYKDFRITANLPRDYLDVNSDSLLKIEICDADAVCKTLARKTLNYVWVDSYISPFTAVVDYKIRYFTESSRPRTAILRYYNRRAASSFGKAIICALDNQLFEKRPSNNTKINRNNSKFNKSNCWE